MHWWWGSVTLSPFSTKLYGYDGTIYLSPLNYCSTCELCVVLQEGDVQVLWDALRVYKALNKNQLLLLHVFMIRPHTISFLIVPARPIKTPDPIFHPFFPHFWISLYTFTAHIFQLIFFFKMYRFEKMFKEGFYSCWQSKNNSSNVYLGYTVLVVVWKSLQKMSFRSLICMTKLLKKSKTHKPSVL